jgi:hypothetical protein
LIRRSILEDGDGGADLLGRLAPVGAAPSTNDVHVAVAVSVHADADDHENVRLGRRGI